jgi:hypothetical protein
MRLSELEFFGDVLARSTGVRSRVKGVGAE